MAASAPDGSPININGGKPLRPHIFSPGNAR